MLKGLRGWWRSQTTLNKLIVAFVLVAVIVGGAKIAKSEVCTDLGGGIITCTSGTKVIRTGDGTAIVVKEDGTRTVVVK